jgi:hypothetical protein
VIVLSIVVGNAGRILSCMKEFCKLLRKNR